MPRPSTTPPVTPPKRSRSPPPQPTPLSELEDDTSRALSVQAPPSVTTDLARSAVGAVPRHTGVPPHASEHDPHRLSLPLRPAARAEAEAAAHRLCWTGTVAGIVFARVLRKWATTVNTPGGARDRRTGKKKKTKKLKPRVEERTVRDVRPWIRLFSFLARAEQLLADTPGSLLDPERAETCPVPAEGADGEGKAHRKRVRFCTFDLTAVDATPAEVRVLPAVESDPMAIPAPLSEEQGPDADEWEEGLLPGQRGETASPAALASADGGGGVGEGGEEGEDAESMAMIPDTPMETLIDRLVPVVLAAERLREHHQCPAAAAINPLFDAGADTRSPVGDESSRQGLGEFWGDSRQGPVAVDSEQESSVHGEGAEGPDIRVVCRCGDLWAAESGGRSGREESEAPSQADVSCLLGSTLSLLTRAAASARDDGTLADLPVDWLRQEPAARPRPAANDDQDERDDEDEEEEGGGGGAEDEEEGEERGKWRKGSTTRAGRKRSRAASRRDARAEPPRKRTRGSKGRVEGGDMEEEGGGLELEAREAATRRVQEQGGGAFAPQGIPDPAALPREADLEVRPPARGVTWSVQRAAVRFYSEELALLRCAGRRAPLPMAGRLSDCLSSAIRFQLRRAFNTHEVEMEWEMEEGEAAEVPAVSPAAVESAGTPGHQLGPEALHMLQHVLGRDEEGGEGGVVGGISHPAQLYQPQPQPLPEEGEAGRTVDASSVVSTASSVSTGGLGRGGGALSRGWLAFVPGTGTLQYNMDDLASLVNRALHHLFLHRPRSERLVAPHSLAMGEVEVEAGPEEDDDAPLTAWQIVDKAHVRDVAGLLDFCLAHRFLRSLLRHEVVLEVALGPGHCWQRLRRLAELVRRFRCKAEWYLLPLTDLRKFAEQLEEEAPMVDKLTRIAKQTLTRHAAALARQRAQRLRKRRKRKHLGEGKAPATPPPPAERGEAAVSAWSSPFRSPPPKSAPGSDAVLCSPPLHLAATQAEALRVPLPRPPWGQVRSPESAPLSPDGTFASPTPSSSAAAGASPEAPSSVEASPLRGGGSMLWEEADLLSPNQRLEYPEVIVTEDGQELVEAEMMMEAEEEEEGEEEGGEGMVEGREGQAGEDEVVMPTQPFQPPASAEEGDEMGWELPGQDWNWTVSLNQYRGSNGF